jgi:TonB family protein
MATVPLTLNESMAEVPEPGASPNARFLAGDVPHGAVERVRFGNSMLVSAATHIGGFFLVLFILSQVPPAPLTEGPIDDKPSDIVWLNVPGPGGGGGGGGNQTPAPPRKVELPGRDKITVPVTKPPVITPEPPKKTPEPEPVPQMNIPAVTTAAGVVELPGALTGVPGVPSQGSGSGGGAGTGTGTGIGSGRGSGLGPGYGGGTGGGAYRPGNGVTMPSVLTEVKPSYTADAMRAKIQGVVMVEAVVREDGTVGQVQVVRSLDPTFGLDQEAVKAVRRWRFMPGRRLGQPVPVLVEIELTFTLR